MKTRSINRLEKEKEKEKKVKLLKKPITASKKGGINVEFFCGFLTPMHGLPGWGRHRKPKLNLLSWIRGLNSKPNRLIKNFLYVLNGGKEQLRLRIKSSLGIEKEFEDRKIHEICGCTVYPGPWILIESGHGLVRGCGRPEIVYKVLADIIYNINHFNVQGDNCKWWIQDLRSGKFITKDEQLSRHVGYTKIINQKS